MRHVLPLIALTALVGCAKNIPVAEGECPDLMRQAFRDASFETEEEEEALQSVLLGLHERCIRDNADIEKAKDRAVNPGPITAEFLDGIPLVPDTTLTDQTPISLTYRSKHPLETHYEGVSDTNQACMGSDSSVFGEKTWIEGEECFFGDSSCTYAKSSTHSFTKNILAKVWIDSFADYWQTTIPFEDGDSKVMVSRGWIEEIMVSTGGSSSWRQRYTLDLYYEDPENEGQTLRLAVYWSEADLPVGDDIYVAAVRDGFQEAFENFDTFMDGEVCDDRDSTEEDWE